MKKLIVLALAFLPALALAAPTGHQVCRDDSGRVELTYGTYGLAGDGPTLKIDGIEYLSDVAAGDPAGSFNDLLRPMCPCDPVKGAKVGTLQWDIAEGSYSEASAIRLTLDMNGLHLKDQVIKCEAADYTPGNEQN